MKRVFRCDGVELWHGDAREVLPGLKLEPARSVSIQDPVWPDAPEGMFPVADPAALFAEAAQHLPRLVRRLVVVLGVRSDPRFLCGVPAALPFVRPVSLRYAVPSFQASMLNGGHHGYVFGDSTPGGGRKLLPGEFTATETRWRRGGHPCERHPAHAAWLVDTFTTEGDTVLDPFAGSGSFLEAAWRQGRRAVGVEVDGAWAELAARNLTETQRQGRLLARPSPTPRQAGLELGSLPRRRRAAAKGGT